MVTREQIERFLGALADAQFELLQWLLVVLGWALLAAALVGVAVATGARIEAARIRQERRGPR